MVSDVFYTFFQHFAFIRKTEAKNGKKATVQQNKTLFQRNKNQAYNFILKIVDFTGKKRNPIYFDLFLKIRTPYFNFWMQIFVMLILQLKALPDIIFGILNSKMIFSRPKTKLFRIGGFHGYCHITSISEKMVGDVKLFFFLSIYQC